MRCSCEAKLSGQWRPATLTTDHSASSYGLPVVVIDGEPHGTGEVETIRVDACPAELFQATLQAGFHVLGKPVKTQRVYIYNENSVQAGRSVAQRIIEEHPNPYDAGDWTAYEGTEAELTELAREMFHHALPGAAGAFQRRVARTIADFIGVNLDERQVAHE